MSKRYSGKSFKDSSVMKKPKLSLKEKRQLKKEKKKNKWKNFLGSWFWVCCGANPMLIWETAEAIGLKVPASKYRENMTEYGDKA